MKKNLFLAIVLASIIWFIPKAHAAITFDASSTKSFPAATTLATTSITVGSGTNNMLFCITATGNITATPTCRLDGILGTEFYTPNTGGNNTVISFWYWPNVAAGAHNVSSSYTSGTQGQMSVASFFGVQQLAPIDATSTNNSGASYSVATATVTTTNDNDLILSAMSHLKTTTTTSLGAGQSSLGLNGGGTSRSSDASYSVASTAGAYTHTYNTNATTTGYLESIVSIKPYVSGYTYISSNICTDVANSATHTCVWSTPPTAGNLLVFVAQWGAPSSTVASSVTDTLGTVYTTSSLPSVIGNGLPNGSKGFTEQIWGGVAPSGGANTTTITFSAATIGATRQRLYVMQFSGNPVSNFFDASSTNNSSTVTAGVYTSGSSTLQANDLVIGAVLSNNGVTTPGYNFTQLVNNSEVVEWGTNPSAGAFSAPFPITASDSWSMAMSAFMLPSIAPAANANFNLMNFGILNVANMPLSVAGTPLNVQ